MANHARVVWYVGVETGDVYRSWRDEPHITTLPSGWPFGGTMAFWSRHEAEKFSRYTRRTRLKKLKEAEKANG